MTWHDLLFLHWPVPVERLRPLVPAPLEVQERDGSGWLAVTPFWMSDVAPRGFPAIPGLSVFPELNVRTYVSFDGRPGVWFLSLDAANIVAVQAARWLYHLPYVQARMSVGRSNGHIEYRSVRDSGAGFEGSYAPSGPEFRSQPGSPENWLTERYCLYAVSESGDLFRTEIHHVPWPLQPATAEIHRNDMPAVHGLEVAGPPALAHYARRLDVIVWLPEHAGRTAG
ncbi:MAG: YqjF family protein [Gemmatimonadales bacterium]